MLGLTEGIWKVILIPLMLLTALLLLLRTRFFVFRRFFAAWQFVFAGEKTKSQNKKQETEGMSPFGAMTTSLAATVGTGSIVGTCQAIRFGGYGAVFWMGAFSLVGMVIKSAEIFLTRSPDEGKRTLGTPMQYLERAFQRKRHPMAILYASAALVAVFGMGNLVQCSAMITIGDALLESRVDSTARAVFVYLLAGALSLLLIYVGKGKVSRIEKITQIAVPFMSLAFIAVTGALIVFHAPRLPSVLTCIVRDAFSPRASIAGGIGITFSNALSWGIRRAVFSSEAGIGSAALAHSLSNGKDAVHESYFGIVEVFIATVVICGMTALGIFVSLDGTQVIGAQGGDLFLFMRAVATLFSDGFAYSFTALMMAVFALSTLIGWSAYGSVIASYLGNDKTQRLFRILFVICPFFAVLVPTGPLWILADFANAMMALPNLIALCILSRPIGKAVRQTKEMKKRKKFLKPGVNKLTSPAICDTLIQSDGKENKTTQSKIYRFI